MFCETIDICHTNELLPERRAGGGSGELVYRVGELVAHREHGVELGAAGEDLSEGQPQW